MNFPLEKKLESELFQLREKGLLREITQVDKNLVNVSATDYLNLGNDPRLRAAAISAVQSYGTGGRGRLLGGNLPLFSNLESEISSLTGFDATLLFTSGYTANYGVLNAVGSSDDIFLVDQLIHASLIDGILATGARLIRYKHLDVEDLKRKYSALKQRGRIFVVTDGLFSMDGSIAPIDQLSEFCIDVDAVLIVDDAHGIGTLGPTGGGTIELFSPRPRVDILTGSLGKSLGAQGGFVACSHEMREYLINHCRPFFFSVSPSPSVCGAAKAAIEIVRSAVSERNHLELISTRFRNKLSVSDFKISSQHDTPIVGLIIGTVEDANRVADFLKARGYYAAPIRPPTVPKGTSRIRFGLSTALSVDVIDELALSILEIEDEIRGNS